MVLWELAGPKPRTVCRSCLLAVLAGAMKVKFLLEQPQHRSSGGLESLPTFRKLASWMTVLCLQELNQFRLQGCAFRMKSPLATQVYRLDVAMAAFFSDTKKPSWLYTNHLCFQDRLQVLYCCTSVQFFASPLRVNL